MTSLTLNLPSVFDEDGFHKFCHDIAAQLPNRTGLSAYDMGEYIKAKVLGYLPSEYVTIEKYVGVMRFFADGTHRFNKLVPMDVMLEAAKAADVIE